MDKNVDTPGQEPAFGSSELLRDANNVLYKRKALNGHWVRYTFMDANGNEAKRVAMPRVEVFSAEEIAKFDEVFAPEDADA